MNRKPGHGRAGLRRRVRADTPCRSTRRAFLLAAAAWPALAWAGAAQAQAKKAPVVIGWLSAGSRDSNAHLLAALKEGLAALGWKEGPQVVFEERWADGQFDGLPRLAAELVQSNPEVIVSGVTRTHLALKAATSNIPIVMATGVDPVGAGLVASLARPSGNLTGLTGSVADMSPKLLDLLHSALPKVTRIAVLMNERHPLKETRRANLQQAAGKLGVGLVWIEVVDPKNFDDIFASIAKQAGALVVPSDAHFALHRERIVRAAAQNRIPAIYAQGTFSEAGGLMIYSDNLLDNYRRAAVYVDKILKGAKPGDLPVQQPTRFELVVNMKTAKALGITIPQTILVQADKVIE